MGLVFPWRQGHLHFLRGQCTALLAHWAFLGPSYPFQTRLPSCWVAAYEVGPRVWARRFGASRWLQRSRTEASNARPASRSYLVSSSLELESKTMAASKGPWVELDMA